MAVLRFENVTVQYPVYNSRSQSLRNQLVRIATGGRISQESRNVTIITALANANFELKDGDSIGLVGHNGAGKTTLLRAMAGIYTPTVGNITREGTIASIIEMGAGMESELSGYENIFRMGMLLGRSGSEIQKLIPEVETLTELGDFLKMPVRTYSAGMTMRLMFAVATSVRPEILLIDEMFSTGDAGFQKKALDRIQGLIESAKIFVFASHDYALIKRYCKTVLSLEHGTIKQIELN